MGQVRITLQNISKSYYAQSSVTQALRKISLTLSQGEFVAITGESGSGKSTLLHIIGGLDSFDEGEMFIDGKPTFPFTDEDWEDYRRNEIGYIFQDYSLVGHYSALDNVMSALLILGQTPQEAREKSLFYLDQVGLNGYEEHPASELSSGQKQRLAIARALAKNTGIIVADEPTGNLDSETGDQILALLSKLSRQYLVVMVTHNYTQALPYITRRIHIHDGMIVSDTQITDHDTVDSATDCDTVNPEQLSAVDSACDTTGSGTQDSRRVRLASYLKQASGFARMNRCTQRGRAVLFCIFLFLVSSLSFLLIEELHLHKDDIFTKVYSTDAFAKEDATRLVAKHVDGSELTSDDITELSDLTYVNTVDSCDLANDVNFYIEQERDYTFIYGKAIRGRTGSTSVSFLDETHFVQSNDCITDEDLLTGTLPQSRDEIVLYGTDESLIGTEITCYFTATNIWGEDQYVATTVIVCGLLKEETEQVYFSKELCQMLTMDVTSGTYRICYEYDATKEDYDQKPALIPIINEELSGNDVKISSKLDGPVGTTLFRYESVATDDSDSVITEEDVNVLEERSECSADFIEVSPEFYARYDTTVSTQTSLYITSYAKTDSVIAQLNRLGYDAVSTYRMSASDYDTALVNERLIIICISAFGLLVLLLGEVLILKALMRIRIKDYFVLKFMGMKMPVISCISYLEMLYYCCLSMGITILLSLILWACHVPVLSEMMWYYSPLAYLEFVLYNIALCSLTVNRFNHLLKGRLRL